LPQIHLYMVLRAALALPLIIAAVIGVFNIFMSLYRPAGETT
jgi:hypothetical protein